MTRSAILYEGNRGRRLPNLAQMNTDPQSGTSLVPWVPALDYIGTYKFISENGTYKAEDEPYDSNGNGIWAYSKVNVNVAGGAAGTEDDIDDVEQMESEEYDETYDPSEEQAGSEEVVQEVEPAGTVDPDTGKVKKGAIRGKDRETGKTKTVRVREVTNPVTGKKKSVLEEIDAPQAIHITRLPKKMSYMNGEEIDITGIEVRLYEKFEEHEGPDGSYSVDAIPFKDDWYPNGVIPFKELGFSPSKADRNSVGAWVIDNTEAEVYSAETEIAYLRGTTLNKKGETVHVTFGDRRWTKRYDGKALAFFAKSHSGHHDYSGPVLISPSSNAVRCWMEDSGGPRFDLGVTSVVVDGKRWYAMWQHHVETTRYFLDPWDESLPDMDMGGQGMSSPSVFKSILNNFRVERYDGDGILVYWDSPYDGQRLTTWFHPSIE